MPLVNCDVKSLEVFVAADLSDDKTLKDELVQRLDLHQLNQDRFKLPDRVTAKRFIFKLLYGATAFGYAQDSDFINVGYSEKQWQKVIDEFYSKYTGIAKWHDTIINSAKREGYLEIPSGRYYNFRAKKTKYGWKWPTTTIKNYPGQGFGAELVKLARVEFYRKFLESGLEGEFICTIHDSLVADVPSKNVHPVATIMREAVEKTPELCDQWFDYKFSLPIFCEIQIGKNKLDMKDIVW